MVIDSTVRLSDVNLITCMRHKRDQRLLQVTLSHSALCSVQLHNGSLPHGYAHVVHSNACA